MGLAASRYRLSGPSYIKLDSSQLAGLCVARLRLVLPAGQRVPRHTLSWDLPMSASVLSSQGSRFFINFPFPQEMYLFPS